MKALFMAFWNAVKRNRKVKMSGLNIIVALFIILVTALVTVVLMFNVNSKKDVEAFAQVDEQPTVTVDYVSAFLAEDSELTTGKLKTTGFLRYEEATGVKFFTKKIFGMLYDVDLRAGIYLDEVKITGVDDGKREIYISMPEAVIFDAHIDPASIEYFDEKFTMFDNNDKEHSNEAQALAEAEALEYAPSTGILEFADEHAKVLIRDMLEGKIYDYKVVFIDE